MMNLIVITLLLVGLIAVFLYCRKSHDYETIISITVVGVAAVVMYEMMKLF